MFFRRPTLSGLARSILPGIRLLMLLTVNNALGVTSALLEPQAPAPKPPPASPPPQSIELSRSTSIPTPLPSLFNCADCDAERSRWFSDVKELRQSAYRCGFDYLQLRFSQHFTGNTLSGRLTVYAHSLPGDSLRIDSAVTAFRTPSSADQTVTVYHHPAQRPFHLPLPSPAAVPPDQQKTIDAVIANAGTFTSRCRFRDNDLRDSWVFSLGGQTYLVEKKRLVISDTLSPSDRSFTGSIEYRLANWGTTPRYPGAFTVDHSAPPKIISLDINDSLTICRITIDCSSRYGLDFCIVSCGSRSDTLRYSGALQRRSDLVFSADTADSQFSLTLVDIYGNTTRRHPPLFMRRREYAKQRAEKRTLDLLSKERASQNPVTFVAYQLSKFSEEPSIILAPEPGGGIRVGASFNPVSSLLKTIFRKKSENYLAGIRDPLPSEAADEVTFPLQGTIGNTLFEKGTGVYSSEFYADRCIFNGTQVAVLVNPTLSRSSPVQHYCSFNLKAPLGTGRYPSSWLFDTSTADTPPASASNVLVCSAIDASRGQVTLNRLPCIFDRPSHRADFAVFHAARTGGSDTLTITYRICYTDRTAELVWQQFSLGTCSVSSRDFSDDRVIETSPRLVTNLAGERCLLLDVHINGNRKIFRIDTFVHSLREHQVVGWGVASLPG